MKRKGSLDAGEDESLDEEGDAEASRKRPQKNVYLTGQWMDAGLGMSRAVIEFRRTFALPDCGALSPEQTQDLEEAVNKSSKNAILEKPKTMEKMKSLPAASAVQEYCSLVATRIREKKGRENLAHQYEELARVAKERRGYSTMTTEQVSGFIYALTIIIARKAPDWRLQSLGIWAEKAEVVRMVEKEMERIWPPTQQYATAGTRPSGGRGKPDGRPMQKTTTPTTRDSSDVTCWKCREVGHYAFECPHKKAKTTDGQKQTKANRKEKGGRGAGGEAAASPTSD